MACSICGLAEHNRRTCARNKGSRIASACLKYGAKEIAFRGLDTIVPGLGLTCQGIDAVMTVMKLYKNGGTPTEDEIVEALSNL